MLKVYKFVCTESVCFLEVLSKLEEFVVFDELSGLEF